MELVAQALKYVSAVLSTMLGLLALTSKFRDDKTERVTTSGRWLFVGIAVSGAVTIGLHVTDDFKQNDARTEASRKTEEQLRRNAELLEQVVRGQYPVRDVRLTIWADTPLDAPALEPFLRRFRAEFPVLAEQIRAGGARSLPGVATAAYGSEPSSLHITLTRQSPLYPRQHEERLAWRIFETTQVRLRFFKTPVSFDRFSGREPARGPAQSTMPDTEMIFGGGRDPLELEYAATGRFGIHGLKLSTDPRDWNSSGRIISVLDLRGAQMFVDMDYSTSTLDGTGLQPPVHAQLRSMSLEFGDLADFRIPVEGMHVHALAGKPIYEYRFPDTTDELMKLMN